MPQLKIGRAFFPHCCGDGEFLDLVRILLHEFCSEYSIVVEIHWLSWGQILSPLVVLWTDITIVLQEKRKEPANLKIPICPRSDIFGRNFNKSD